jgi:hypothetical protein
MQRLSMSKHVKYVKPLDIEVLICKHVIEFYNKPIGYQLQIITAVFPIKLNTCFDG